MDELKERAMQKAMAIRLESGVPVRVYVREVNGEPTAIWSKVDENNRDLTAANSDGMLHHVRSVFVRHGALNPMEALLARIEELEAERAQWFEPPRMG